MSGLLLLIAVLIIVVGVLQLPLIIDLIRSCSPSSKRIPRRLVGPVIHTLLALIMMLIFVSVFYMYFWRFLPAHVGGDPWLSNLGLCHIIFFFFLYLNTIANYICSIFISPGFPPKTSMAPDNQLSISIEKCIPKEKICVECKCMKADTTHHCSVCKACVLHMDHHCPFVMGCVGLGNYNYFYTFMINFYVGMLYSMYMMWGPFLHCHGMAYQDVSYNCKEVGAASVLLVIVGLNIPGATIINLFNTLALLSNTTTMSCLMASMRNGFKASLRNLLSQLSFEAVSDPRSRLNVVILSKRKHVLYFFVPPIFTAVKLCVKHALSKKRTINFTLPKIPKKTGLIA